MNTYDLREFFSTGNTLGYDFRILQLKKLKEALNNHQEEIVEALRLDMEKPSYEAFLSEIAMIHQELNQALDNLASWMKRERVATPIYLKPAVSYVEKRPKGLVFILSPWNYPFLLSFSPLISALAAGNCCIVKPSKKAKHSYQLIEKIIGETFEPNYVAFYKESSDQVLGFLESSNLDHVFFTGSPQVGRKLGSVCASRLIPFSLELGGKSPAIVDDTGDLDLAAKKLAWAKFLNLGQTCIAPDYLLLKENIQEDFINMLIGHLKIFYGNNIKDNPDYGRIINQERTRHLAQLLEGADLVYGGDVDIQDRFISPSLVKASLGDPLMKEEIFGPILPILSFRDNSEIIDIVEANPNPLSLYVFSDNQGFIDYILEGLQFGGGCINDAISHMVNTNLPFGGIRQSGSGSYHSSYGFYEFSQLRPILHTTRNIDIDIKYPPYTKTKTRLANFFLK